MDETENVKYPLSIVALFGFLKGNLRPEFKEVMTAYFLGDRYRDFTGNDALGYYRVTPEGIHVTIDYYIDPDFYHRLTIKTIHTLIRRELWGGDNFPVYFYDPLPAVGGWEPMRRGRGRWDNKDFRPGSKLLQELNPDFYDSEGRFRHGYFEENYKNFVGDLEFNERQCEIVQFFAIEGAPPPKNLRVMFFKHIPSQSLEVNERIFQHFVEKFKKKDR